MYHETSFQTYADPDTDDPRAHHPGQSPRRGEVLRQFLEQGHAVEFKQYPRLEAAWHSAQLALEDLGFSEQEQTDLLTHLLATAEDSNFNSTITELRTYLQQEIKRVVQEKIGQLQPDDLIRLQPLEQALRIFHIRALEVLAVFQKQERQHIASHRAHSSRHPDTAAFIFHGPELSLEALREACKQGVKTIEIDITALGDGTPVVTHNLRSRTNEGKKKLNDIPNLAEAQRLNATIDRTGANLYSMAELFTVLEPYKNLVNINLEIKDPQSIPQLVQLIQEHQLERMIVISSYHHAALLELHQQLPELKLGVNTTVAESNINQMLHDQGSSDVVPSEEYWVKGFYYQHGLPEALQKALRDTQGYLSVTMPVFKVTTLAQQWVERAVQAIGEKSVFGKGLRQFQAVLTTLRDPMVEQMRALKQRADQQGIKLLMFRVTSEQAAIVRNEIDDLHVDAGESLTYQRMARTS